MYIEVNELVCFVDKFIDVIENENCFFWFCLVDWVIVFNWIEVI